MGATVAVTPIFPLHPYSKKSFKIKLLSKYGGEGGIRTLGSVNATPDFESGTFDHSATSPKGEFYQQLAISCRMLPCADTMF